MRARCRSARSPTSRRGPSRLGGGLYLRTDFWAQITSGGSYGHTCYVAKELAARRPSASSACWRSDMRCSTTSACAQVVMDAPTTIINEDAIVSATTHYYPIVKAACEVLRPAYIYERLCLGNYVAALLSRELQIPYIVEYNGSEISMQRSFDGTAPFYADVYLKAEEARIPAGDADLGHLRAREEATCSRAASMRARFWSIPMAPISTAMRRRLPKRSSDPPRARLSRDRSRHRFHRNLRRLARHRRARGGDPANLRGAADGEVPDDRRWHAQAAARRRGRARTGSATGCAASAVCRRPRARGC